MEKILENENTVSAALDCLATWNNWHGGQVRALCVLVELNTAIKIWILLPVHWVQFYLATAAHSDLKKMHLGISLLQSHCFCQHCFDQEKRPITEKQTDAEIFHFLAVFSCSLLLFGLDYLCNCAPAELILSSEVKCSKRIKFTCAVNSLNECVFPLTQQYLGNNSTGSQGEA